MKFFRTLFLFVIFFLNSAYADPGGVSTNGKLWLKADSGTNTTSDGVDVNSWANNFLPAESVQSLIDDVPTYINNIFNFNPAITFDGVDDNLSFAAKQFNTVNDITIIAVAATTDTRGALAKHWGIGNQIISTEDSNIDFSVGVTNGKFGAGINEGDIVHSINNVTVTPFIGSFTRDAFGSGNGSNLAVFVNGKLEEFTFLNGRPTDGEAFGGPGGGSSVEFIGSTGTSEHFFNGNMAEIIGYTAALNATDRQKIETYLALKYGITLDQTVPANYLDSSGAIIWDSNINVAYNQDIAGLAKDDLSALDQKVSQSINNGANLSVATINDFTLPNNDASRLSLSSDKQFLIWGSNGGAMSTQVTEVPTGIGSRITREWLVQNTASVAAVNLQFDNLPTLTSSQQYLLYEDSDGDFSAGASKLAESTNGVFTAITFAGSAATVTTYLTIAIENPPTEVKIDNASSGAVDENQPIGTDVGALTSTDADLPNDNHSYSFACASAGADDGLFSIVGTSLKTAVVFDHENPNNKTYNICIRTTDALGLFFDQNLTITINDLNEAPSIADATFSVLENSANSTSVGTPTSSDPEGNTLAYSITGGNTGGVFAISSTTGEITVANGSLLDNETIPSL